MPKGADFAYSVAYLIGGEFGARLWNLAMLLLLQGLLYAHPPALHLAGRKLVPRGPLRHHAIGLYW